MEFRRCLVAATSLVFLTANLHASPPDFSRAVRPILSDHCFACHGPDEHKREADLRLDTSDGLSSVVEPADVDASELIARIESTDPDEMMPPREFHKPLSAAQKRVLKQWVEDGAEFQQHWAFIPPTRPEIPADFQGRSAIDYFIARRVAEVGLELNEIADRRTLLRRVCLDLTGLPPMRAQIDRFLADDSPDAYEKLVDRLLESHEFGQHAGRYWLDLVRYADTHGLHLDNYREMWPYRDWVIDAVNANMPFDQFLTSQLAGDLLPEATDADKIASGFNRLNVTTNEGGSIYDEVFARNCIDRTDAFGTIFLGLTTGCAVCHDHKFDPVTMRDYYSLLAFFNSLDGRAMDANVKDPAPVISVPSEEQRTQLAEFDQGLQDLRREMRGSIETVDQAQRAWEQSLVDGTQPRTQVLKPTEVSSKAKVEMKIRDDGSVELVGTAAAKDSTFITASLPSGAQWQTLRLQALTDGPDDRVGVSVNGNVVLSEITIEIKDSLSDGKWIKVPITYAFADVEQSDGPFAVSYAIDSKANDSEGWAVAGHQQPGGRTAWFVVPSLIADGKDAEIRVHLEYQSKHAQHQFRRVRLSLSDAAPAVPSAQKITLGAIHGVGPFSVESPAPGYSRKFASQQGEFKADEVFNHEDRSYGWQHRTDLLEVEVNELPVITDRSSVVVLHQTITAPAPLKITLLIGSDDGHVVFLGGKQAGTLKGPRKLNPLAQEYALALKKGDNDLYIKVVNHSGSSQLTYAFRSPAIDVPKKLVKLLSVSPDQRTQDEQAALQKYYRAVYCLHPDWLALIDQEKGTRKAKEKLSGEISTTLVWKETKEPRQAHILTRGQYDQPADAVERATPAFLSSFPADAPKDRLGLSMWLTSPDHPLTARVAVNRYWQAIFGTGLVKTSEDFGSQGAPPSHPELLDWLAVDFRENRWDVKRLLKMMVMTDAYRRSQRVTDAGERVDPANRLLARGPRHRLDAEVLRDQALALSGLLIDEQGGPSVKPPQPDGLWAAVGYSGSNTVRFKGDKGDKIYRRSVYTFWKRTSPPPQMSMFDAPSRESCTARRERTNTPLQALLLMNEAQFVQAANHLAKRALAEPALSSTEQRVEWLFETVTARLPREHEMQEMQEMLALMEDMTAYYHEHPKLATKLVGNSDASVAAWTILASTLLNLDEVISK
jgi:hypothetical protein